MFLYHFATLVHPQDTVYHLSSKLLSHLLHIFWDSLDSSHTEWQSCTTSEPRTAARLPGNGRVLWFAKVPVAAGSLGLFLLTCFCSAFKPTYYCDPDSWVQSMLVYVTFLPRMGYNTGAWSNLKQWRQGKEKPWAEDWDCPGTFP